MAPLKPPLYGLFSPTNLSFYFIIIQEPFFLDPARCKIPKDLSC
jgi:hypothetical protein